MSRTIPIALGERAYDVIVAADFSELARAFQRATTASRAVLVTDETVAPLWADEATAALGVRVDRVVLEVSEARKDVAAWSALVDHLLDLGVDRRTPVVALGGGVVGDIAGFGAAVTLRGLPFVQLPTTLLAMVDSSVGGKTGVNHRRGKNLIGAFHQPRLVFAALHTLATLDPAERIAGLGEVLKTALVGDAELLTFLDEKAEALRVGDRDAVLHVVSRCIEIKAEVVAIDEREGGWRAVLNAGHTVAHGYEMAAGYGVIRHGEAVAMGLVAETAWAVQSGHCKDRDLPARLVDIAGRLGLRTNAPELPRERVLAGMQVDKKRRGDILVLPVPLGAGTMKLVEFPANALSDLLPETP